MFAKLTDVGVYAANFIRIMQIKKMPDGAHRKFIALLFVKHLFRL